MEGERTRFVLGGSDGNGLGGLFPPEQQQDLERRLMGKLHNFLFPSWFLTMFNTGIVGSGITTIDYSKSFPGATLQDLEKSMLYSCANCMDHLDPEIELFSCNACVEERPILNRTSFCKRCYEKGQLCRGHGMKDGHYTLKKNGDGKIIPELLGRDLRLALHRLPESECDCGNGKCKGGPRGSQIETREIVRDDDVLGNESSLYTQTVDDISLSVASTTICEP
jgi:hypothetical protein